MVWRGNTIDTGINYRNHISWAINELKIIGFIERVEQKYNVETGYPQNLYVLGKGRLDVEEAKKEVIEYMESILERERERKKRYQNKDAESNLKESEN